MLTNILQSIVVEYSYGSICLGDLVVLHDYCEGKGLVVELGTNKGTTTKILSKIANEVITVDVFEDVNEIDNMEQREFYRQNHLDVPVTYHGVLSYLAECKNVKILKSKTTEAANSIQSNSVDVLFIDADHSYEGVKADFEAWFSRVKVGGYFLFHDKEHYDTKRKIGFTGVGDFYRNVLKEDSRLNEHYPCPNVNQDSQFTSIAVFAKRMEK